MIRRVFLIVIAALIAAAMSNAAQSVTKVTTINTGQVPTSDGRQMYASYCASCHGVDGRGHGPAAAALKAPPPDLTILRKTNGGRFPATHVISILQFGVETPTAHGSAEMPVWGKILDRTNGNTQARALRISNLTGYLETIQAQ